MFGNNKTDDVSPEVTGNETRSHVAEGMTIKGDVEGNIDLLLEGRLEGNLRCRSVHIGKVGEVAGRIVAQTVLLEGKVVGDIEAKAVTFNETAEMIGDVRHDVIEVASGARIDGHYGRLETNDPIKTDGKGHGNHALLKEKTPPPKAPATLPTASKDRSPSLPNKPNPGEKTQPVGKAG